MNPVHALPPVAVVSLDALAADPTRASTLPPAIAEALQSKCLVVLNALWGRCLAARATVDTGSEPDSLLAVAAAATRLGVSRDWLYHHARHLPFVVRQGRLLRFSSRGIDRYIKARQGRPQA
jgi:predicted DNA-binding transcriptional regulator AlpA